MQESSRRGKSVPFIEVCQLRSLPKLWTGTFPTNARRIRPHNNPLTHPLYQQPDHRYQYAWTSWIWIRPSDRGTSLMTSCINLSVSPRHKTADGCKSRISKPRVVYNPFSHREPHKVLQPTTNSQQRKNIRPCPPLSQPQFIYNAICQGDVGDKRGVVIRRKWCPWWRRTDVIKAVSCCRARKPTPTTWNYLNHASASR